MALLETIRTAIVTKADADLATIRQAAKGRPRRAIGGLPAVFVFIPRFTMEQRPGAVTERYQLVFPGHLSVPAPDGERRADTEAADLLYGVIVAWRSGIQLGLGGSGVAGSWLSDATPSYDDSDLLDGYDLTWTVDMLETLATPRTV